MQLINKPSTSTSDLYATDSEGTAVQLVGDNQTAKQFATGNVTFVPIPRLSSKYSQVQYYYRYIFQGPNGLDLFSPQEEVSTQQPNLTREYVETGHYNYTVHAIGLVNKVIAHHAKYSGFMTFYGKKVRSCVQRILRKGWNFSRVFKSLFFRGGFYRTKI